MIEDHDVQRISRHAAANVSKNLRDDAEQEAALRILTDKPSTIEDAERSATKAVKAFIERVRYQARRERLWLFTPSFAT